MSPPIATQTLNGLGGHWRGAGAVAGEVALAVAHVTTTVALAFALALLEGIEVGGRLGRRVDERRGENGVLGERVALGEEGQAHRVVFARRLVLQAAAHALVPHVDPCAHLIVGHARDAVGGRDTLGLGIKYIPHDEAALLVFWLTTYNLFILCILLLK